jgi:heme exporter protein A
MEGLKVKNLNCMRGNNLVFSDISLNILPGRVLLLSGENGSGKSSFLRIVAGLLVPTSGTIFWKGKDISLDLESHHRRGVFIGHANPIKPIMTVRENLEFWTNLNNLKVDINIALKKFDLNKQADLPAHYLSAGQCRRLVLARLAINNQLIERPPIWMLDEPAAGVDPQATHTLAVLVIEHLKNLGIAIIASHGGELDNALVSYADHLELLKDLP